MMRDSSRPQRIEVLESRVGEVKAKLSHTRAEIEHMMGMMQQLLQAKSADGGQQEEENSGGSGRVDANDESGGRAPREEGAAGTRVGATTGTTGGGGISCHGSIASDGSSPSDSKGQRPEVPAGVGPINMQRGDAIYSFLPGAAHDCDGVLGSGFQRQSRIVPPVLKGEFQNFKHEFLLKANMLDISGHFVGQGTRVVLEKDPFKRRVVLLRKYFSSEEIREALQSEEDKSILKRCKLRREAFDRLKKWYDPKAV